VLFALLESDLRRKYDHYVIFFGVEELRAEYEQACTRLGVQFAHVKKRGRLAIRSHREVLGIIRDFAPDVVMINGTPLAIPILGARRLRGHRWRVLVRETQANDLKTLQEWLGSYVAARLADAVVYLTDEHREEIEGRLRIARGRRGEACTIPNGVEVGLVHTGRVAGDLVRIAMVSRVVPIKDQMTLIDAVGILVRERGQRHVLLSIAGDGPSLPGLRARAAAAGVQDQVRFTGLLDQAGISELLAETDIYAHCTFGETMSNSILEAMAAGLPVVASDVRGVSNFIRDGIDGILVPVREPTALADVLHGLILDSELRLALGSAAQERIRTHFSRERMVSDYSGLFARLAAPRKHENEVDGSADAVR
jgi:glycosyltransferase involved in cell wall biosynthesis